MNIITNEIEDAHDKSLDDAEFTWDEIRKAPAKGSLDDLISRIGELTEDAQNKYKHTIAYPREFVRGYVL